MEKCVLAVAKKPKHRRNSRFGCRNCKLRKLKCDETKPHCVKCRTYGVLCNFGFNIPDLQPLAERRAKREIARRPRLSSPQFAISNAIWSYDGSTFYMINQQDKDLFDRFRCRTLYSLGSSEVVEIYNSYILDASFSCPFLMHGMLAVTAVHDRYLGVTSPTRRSIQESYHWSQCTVEFNKFIRQPIQERHKDPIWATAGITAVLTFASINSSPSEETWPLGAPDSSDLEWLRWGAAKMTLWQLVDPQRPNSVFRSMAETLASMRRRLPTAGTDGVWAELRDLCGLTDSSNQENSPYFSAAHSLSRLLDMPPDEPPQGRVMTVLGHMHRQFGTCLEKKDPVALLMLCLWYTRAREAYWWIDLRARQELPAICAYLQRYHKDDRAIQCLVPWDEAMTITY